MIADPVEIPVTIPVPVPTVAIVVLLLVQIPPEVASCNVVAEPTQIAADPLIESGFGHTVIVFVLRHPIPNE
jgi:hypothetical protein